MRVSLGVGFAVTMPPVTSVVLSSVPPARAGTASAVFNTFRQIGGAVAIAVFGAFVADSDSFVPGMQLSLSIAAVLVVGAAAASLLLGAAPARAEPGRRSRTRRRNRCAA